MDIERRRRRESKRWRCCRGLCAGLEYILKPGVNLRICLRCDGESWILRLEARERLRVDEDFARCRDTSGTLVKESEVFAIRAGRRAESSVEAVNELNVSEGVLVTEAAEGDCSRRRSDFDSIPVSRRGIVGFVSCVSEGGNPRAGIDCPAAVRACTTDAQPCSSTLIRSLSS